MREYTRAKIGCLMWVVMVTTRISTSTKSSLQYQSPLNSRIGDIHASSYSLVRFLTRGVTEFALSPIVPAISSTAMSITLRIDVIEKSHRKEK